MIDADDLVHEAQAPGSPVLAEIVARFGSQVLHPDGSLDRDALRRRMLADPRDREALNAIVHPAIRARRAQLLEQARARGDRIVVSDIPLLFEVLDPDLFDAVVLVDAPVPVRRARLLRERDLPPDQADRLLAAQLPAADKRARSDVVIDNDGTLDDLRVRARHAWQTLLDLASDAG